MPPFDIVMREDMALVRGGFSAGITSSPRYRIMVVCAGGGMVSLSGRVCEAVPCSVMLLSPFDLLYIPEKTAKTLDAYLFEFDPSALHASQVSLLMPFEGDPYVHPAHMTDGEVSLVTRFDDLMNASSQVSETMARLYLTELLLRLSQHPLETEALGGVARAARYLKEHLHEDVTLDALAEIVGISKFYLCRAFNRDSGLTPHAYLNHLRAYQARRLLEGGMSAADAAASVGFADYSTFFRTYRKIIGRSPTTREED